MKLVECVNGVKDLPLNEKLGVFANCDLELTLKKYKAMFNGEPDRVYHIGSEYRFSLPEEKK